MSVDLTGIYNTSLDTYSDWKPHPDWVIVPDPEINEAYILESSAVETNPTLALIATTSAGQYQVNWGDGTIINYNSNTLAEHTYTTGGKDCSLGYQTWLVKVKGLTDNITSFKFQRPSDYTISYRTHYNGVLYVKFNLPYCNFNYLLSNSSYNYSTKLIQAIIFADDAVSMNFGYMLAYNGSSNLRYIKFPKNYTNSIDCGNLNYTGLGHYVDCTNYNELINKASNLQHLRFLVNYIGKKLTVNNLNASVWARDSFQGIFEEIEINNLNVLTYFETAFTGTIVKKVTINTQINATEMASAFNTCAVKEIIGTEYLGSRTSDVNGTDMFYLCANLTSPIIMYAKFTKFGCYGTSIRRQPITSIRLMNPNSTFSGTSPQIDVSYNLLDATALNTLFGDLPVLSGKTIKITGNPGAGTCDTSIATSKGWTVQN